ncbi:MAG: hypothetical protein HY225_01625 [Candidatus Vogelbacteria bacterium]|nr:hypothetical protein [Candidatus Vogelbacteria bacterium]
MKSCYSLTIEIRASRDRIHVGTYDASKIDVENLISSFIDIFNQGSPALDDLKSLYQETDVDGVRLWVDRGLQSPAYYAMSQKLRRKMLDKVIEILKVHGVKYHKNWGPLGGFLELLGESLAEVGPLMAIPAMVIYPFYWLRENLFKEKRRQERLEEYKKELGRNGKLK